MKKQEQQKRKKRFCCSCIIAAEQKARATYDNILRLADDPDVIDVIRFLREREIVHYQRFGEAKRKDTSKVKSAKEQTGIEVICHLNACLLF